MSESQSGYAEVVDSVWNRRIDFASMLQYIEQLNAAGSSSLAAVLYQTWLKRMESPYNSFAWFNLGALLFSQGEAQAAGDAYEQAISLSPRFIQPRFNLGLVYERQGKIDEAIAQWVVVEEHANPENQQERSVLIASLNNRARLQEGRKQFADATECLNRSLALDPQQTDVMHHWIFIRAKQCNWPVYAPPEGVDPELLRQSTSALALLSLDDDPEMQLKTARSYVERKLPSDLPRLAPENGYRHKKIRIAYCSSDFCLHPVSMLTVELIELHDRDKFEVYGFCWSPDDGSALRQRIVKAFDHYIGIHQIDEEASARLIREHEIDILIDLQGQTSGARLRMLELRPAPIQITYLGLPATTGLRCIDYVIADRFLIPEESAKFYSEKPLYLPDVYQSSDRKRLSAPAPTRRGCGLPAEGFVFCSFNNNYKYTSEIFAAWMRILKRVPNSVLWLLSDNPWAEQNLLREAENHGVEQQRLVFGKREWPERYLARYIIADLFLDTFPFNAGTTANDALWMGLPVLTMSGRSFASRMAGALLTAARLAELITYDLQAYENKAVELALQANGTMRLREHLEEVRERGVLFNTQKLVENLENELVKIVNN